VLGLFAESEEQPADVRVGLTRSLLAVVLAPLVLSQRAGARYAAVDRLLPRWRGSLNRAACIRCSTRAVG
jgi:hypothetical protein